MLVGVGDESSWRQHSQVDQATGGAVWTPVCHARAGLKFSTRTVLNMGSKTGAIVCTVGRRFLGEKMSPILGQNVGTSFWESLPLCL